MINPPLFLLINHINGLIIEYYLRRLCTEWITPPPQGFWRLCTTHGQSLAHQPLFSTYKGHFRISRCHKFPHSAISPRTYMMEVSTLTTSQLLVVKPTTGPPSGSPESSAMFISQISSQSTQTKKFVHDGSYYYESGELAFVVEDTLFKVNILAPFKPLNGSP